MSEVTPGDRMAIDAVDELAAVRELVVRAYPDAVPELIGGGSVAEVLASVEAARAAYRRVIETAGERAAGAAAASTAAAPSVPAGAVTPLVVDPERLPATEKIRRGLAGRRT